jgi:hypothetical protein
MNSIKPTTSSLFDKTSDEMNIKKGELKDIYGNSFGDSTVSRQPVSLLPAICVMMQALLNDRISTAVHAIPPFGLLQCLVLELGPLSRCSGHWDETAVTRSRYD